MKGSGISDKTTRKLTDKAGIVIDSGDRVIVNFPGVKFTSTFMLKVDVNFPGVKFTSTFNMFFFNGLVRKSLPLIR